ncbi:hypothetical protein [Micromonospora wenchangensis]|uniref:hypothetical protein n=1 Tax=Micromonospora wenchangensis TaxID=1185415 RepID=UPI0037FEB2DD
MAVSTFEGLALGAANAATAGFDFIASPAGGGATIINTLPYRGAQCMQLTTGTAGGICYAERTTSVGVNSTGQVFGRLRFRVPVLPPDSTGMRIILVADSTGSFRAEVRLIDSGKLQLRNAAGTVLATSTLTLTVNTYADVGLAVLVFSTSVGQIEMRIWDAAGSIAETLTSPANQNTTGAGGLCKLQVGAARSGVNNYTVVVDDVDWATGDYPSIPSSSATVDAAASLSAASSLTAAAVRVAPSTATLSSGSAVTAAGVAAAVAASTLSSASNITANALTVQPAAASLGGASDFDADATAVSDASADLAAAGLLLADATVTAGEEAGVALPAWAPTVAQVADHIPYMTVDVVTPGSQAYLGTFSVATSPTDVQALRLIEGAWPPVAAALGLVAEAVYPLAQHVTALRAAAAIVRAFPRDDGDLAKAAALDARADADLLRLISANDAAGSEPVLMPVYSFPPAPAWGDWLL